MIRIVVAKALLFAQESTKQQPKESA